MTHREASFDRVVKTLRGERPDRVPYVEHWTVNQQVVEDALGRTLPTLGWFDDAGLVVDMLDHFLACGKRAMEIVCDLPEIDVILINDDVCTGTGTMVSPTMVSELWKPRIEKLIERLGPARYIVSSSNSLIQDITPADFRPMTDTMRDWPV